MLRRKMNEDKKTAISLAPLLLLAAALLASAKGSGKSVELDQATIPELNAAMAANTLTAERLVQMCLARIEAYDRQGPQLRAVISLNSKATETARALDVERKAKGPRSPLHGIPVVLKDNIDTHDLPTTGGSVFLKGSMAPDDAFVVKKLRDAGAIILAKVNLGEFSVGTQSSLGGQSLNPHDLMRTPSGSSSGTGVAIAAGYAPIGIGTDTAGSIRGPSSVSGIVGLKPTYGLISRDGIIPATLSLDTDGPMTRSVTDVAVSLGIMAGVDRGDETTKMSQGRVHSDYTQFLKSDGLKGARIGLVRDYMGGDAEVDWIIEAAVGAMRKAGATVVEVRFPKWFLNSSTEAVKTLYHAESAMQLGDYLKTIGPEYPKSIDDLIEHAKSYFSLGADGTGPNIERWQLFQEARDGGKLTDPRYTVLRDHYMPMIRALVEGTLANDKLDALVYPTLLYRPEQLTMPAPIGSFAAALVANLTGFPDLVVPAGFTTNDLPVTISFLGPAFSEPKLLTLGYSFEQATRALRRPVHTPALPGGTIEVPSR